MRISFNPVNWFKSSLVTQLQEKVSELENEFGVMLRAQSHAGVKVTQTNAIESEIVYTCIRDKSESIGQLPVVVKRNGKVLEKGNREHRIFSVKPNDFQTTQDFFEMIVTCLELYGNFYAYIVRNKYGNISEIIPFRHQLNTSVHMDTFGRVYFMYTTNDGKPNIAFTEGDILHIKLNSLNGYEGLSPISAAARTIGISIAQEAHLAGLMEKGSMPSGILTTDAIFKDDKAITRIRDQWSSSYSGLKNTGKTPVLENGLKYQQLSLSPVDSELIKQRVFSRIQLAGIFRVPLTRVGVVEAQRYDSVEENNRSYLRDSLVPIITKIENAINNVLPDTLTIKIDTRYFARGDRKSQVEAVGQEFKLGGISIAEMREDLDRPYVEGSEVHAIDTNNLTFGNLTDIPKLQEQARQQAVKPAAEVNEDE